MRRTLITTFFVVALPWELGLGIWSATAGHTLIAASLLAAAVITIMEMSNGRPF